jgi:hypothetical protein
MCEKALFPHFCHPEACRIGLTREGSLKAGFFVGIVNTACLRMTRS